MAEILEKLHKALHQLIGYHRQLLEIVRIEQENLTAVNLKSIQETVYAKEILINSIYGVEKERSQIIAELSVIIKKPISELTLQSIINLSLNAHRESSEKLRIAFNTLSLLVERIREQNKTNGELLERSIEHVDAMKKNILGEKNAKSSTYSRKGGKVKNLNDPQLISSEA